MVSHDYHQNLICNLYCDIENINEISKNIYNINCQIKKKLRSRSAI